MEYSSVAIGKAVEGLSKFPGIGKKTALRMALYLLRSEKQVTLDLAKALVSLVEDVVFCERCFHISEKKICGICENFARDQKTICVVKDFQDVFVSCTGYAFCLPNERKVLCLAQTQRAELKEYSLQCSWRNFP